MCFGIRIDLIGMGYWAHLCKSNPALLNYKSLRQTKMEADLITTQKMPRLVKAASASEKKPENKLNTLKTSRIIILSASIVMMLTGGLLVYLLQPEFEQLHLERMASTWGFYFIVFSLALMGYKLLYFLFNVMLYFKYKPIESVTDQELPTCTVIVPAYNEGHLVYDTLKSLAASDYPAEKLQLLVFDDGSKDDTWEWMKKAKAILGDKVSIYQQPKNMGKRHALYRGFKMGTGDVFVTVDSDSVVKADTLRNLVSPFVVNEHCGAVAGNVLVLNNNKAIIPKMLNVSFVLSFEFMRSAQSAMGSVLCTPGALSAYRREAVFNCLEDWINQTFNGQPSDIGEDRAMTNMIMKQGYHVLFQRNSYVLTNVPEKYKGLYKMFIRWGRSNVRENLMMAKYVFKKFRPQTSRFGTRLVFFDQSLNMLLTYPFLLLMLVMIVMHPLLFISSALFGILLASSFSVLFYAKRYNLQESLWAYSYSFLYTFGLFWIAPYAIATASRRGWLTRG
jgi:hyaluronan synthase